MNRAVITAAVLAACAALAPAASAQTGAAAGPWAIGLRLGPAHLGVVCNASALPCDRRGNAATLLAERRLDGAWSAQLSLHAARGFAGSDRSASGAGYGGELDFDLVGASLAWSERVGPLRVGLRGGLAAVRGEFRYTAGGSGRITRNTLEPLAGAWIEWPLSPTWALQLDLQNTRGRVHSLKGDLNALTLGAMARF